MAQSVAPDNWLITAQRGCDALFRTPLCQTKIVFQSNRLGAPILAQASVLVTLKWGCTMNVAAILAWAGGSAAIYAFFSRLDDLVTLNTKSDMSAFLGRKSDNKPNSLALIFNNTFNTIYGKRYFSLRFLISSCLVTIIFVSIFTFILETIRPASIRNIPPPPFLGTLALACIVAVPLDILSLLKCRFILKRTYKNKWIFFVSADFIATTLLVYVDLLFWSLCVFAAKNNIKSFDNVRFSAINGSVIYMAKQSLINLTYASGVLYSTLSTCLWALLFFVSSLFAAISSYFTQKMQKHFNIEQKPFSVIGLFASIIVSILYLIVGLVSIAF